MAKIEVKNVTKIIKGNKVADNISLTLESPRVVGFKGKKRFGQDDAYAPYLRTYLFYRRHGYN